MQELYYLNLTFQMPGSALTSRGIFAFASPELREDYTLVLVVLRRREQFHYVDVAFISPWLRADRDTATAVIKCDLEFGWLAGWLVGWLDGRLVGW